MENAKEIIWFIYDGECPICRAGVKTVRIKEAVGQLRALDKRTADPQHPVIVQTREAGLNLNKGMVIAYGGQLYQGADALHLMAAIGSEYNWVSMLSARIFRSRWRAKLCYPFLRGARNVLLACKGIGQIKEPATHGES